MTTAKNAVFIGLHLAQCCLVGNLPSGVGTFSRWWRNKHIFGCWGNSPHFHSKGDFEISYLALSEKATISKMLTFEYRVLVYFWWPCSFFDICTLDISLTVTPKPINHTIFWNKSEDFSIAPKCFAQTVNKVLL